MNIEPGFYWANIKGSIFETIPTIVEYCDEGGDQFFTVLNQDWTFDANEFGDAVTILNRIPGPQV